MKHLMWILLALIMAVASPAFEATAEVGITARYSLNTADSLAATYAGDVQLALVISSEVDTTGRSQRWQYVYFSMNSSKEYDFIAENNQVTFDTMQGIRTGVSTMRVAWIDSDSALSIAERVSGAEVRRSFPGCTVAASLLNPLNPGFLSSYWRVDYRCIDSIRTVVIDAADGQVITSAEEDVTQRLPLQPMLYQNFPNPFNPSTTIGYELPRRSHVTLTVFNMLGQQVATLLNGEIEAGSHSVQLDGSRLASGVYIYRLTAGAFASSRKMLVIK